MNARSQTHFTAIAVEIPYLLETNRAVEALQAFEKMFGLAENIEEKQAVLYAKARVYLFQLKNESLVLSVLEELIDLDPLSNTALLAQNRINKLHGGSLPPSEPAISSDQGGIHFSAVNYPNPANPGTNIIYTLPAEGKVVLKIYNILGYEVAELVNGSMPAGSHQVLWDGRDKFENPTASGLYFYRILFRDQVLIKKFTLLK